MVLLFSRVDPGDCRSENETKLEEEASNARSRTVLGVEAMTKESGGLWDLGRTRSPKLFPLTALGAKINASSARTEIQASRNPFSPARLAFSQ